MTQKEIKDFQPIVQAWVEGKTIEYNFDEGWRSVNIEHLLGDISKYRIKPEAKYRPFKTQEECWKEMLKHQPFGWLKEKANKKEIAHIGRIFDVPNDTLITLSIDEGRNLSSSYFFRTYTFVDGTPFGIKEEK